MAWRYPTPRELVEALQQRGDGARAQLHEMLYTPIDRLMEAMRGRYRLQHKQETLTRNALHAAETYLRTRSVSWFASMDWPAFRAAVLLHVAKLASQPHGQPVVERTRPEQLPTSLGYDSEFFSLPYERIGDSWFGGDWFGSRESADGSLWISPDTDTTPICWPVRCRAFGSTAGNWPQPRRRNCSVPCTIC
jgi:hypothetical protein